MPKISGVRCLLCSEKLDRVACITVDGVDIRIKPKTGDIAVCLCGHVMIFDAKLQLRNLTDEENIALAEDPRILAARIKGK